MRRSVLLVLALALVLGAAPACSDKTNGAAVPGNPTGQEPTTGNSTTTPTRGTSSSRPTSSGLSPITGKDPCTLLTPNAQASLGVSNGQKRDVGGARGCQWTLRGPSDTYFFGVGIRDKAGIKDIPAEAGAKQLPDVGTHKAVQAIGLGGPGTCAVIMDVTDSSRVDVTTTAGNDQQKACDLAMQTAKLVEPELP